MKLKLIATVSILVSALSAAPITGLFNTGQSVTGTADNYWTVVAPPGAAQVIALATIPNTWLPNTGSSSWVWANTTGLPVGTPSSPLIYTFRYSFNLDSSLNASTAAITGRWSTDNTGTQIRVNGVATANPISPIFDTWTGFSLGSLFQAGANTIEFVVEDTGFLGGFRAEWLTATADLNTTSSVPEPASMTLLGAGLVIFGLKRRTS